MRTPCTLPLDPPLPQMANTMIRGGKSYCIMKIIKERKTPEILTLTVQLESFTAPDQRKEGLTKSKTARNVGPMILNC